MGDRHPALEGQVTQEQFTPPTGAEAAKELSHEDSMIDRRLHFWIALTNTSQPEKVTRCVRRFNLFVVLLP